jgi:dephospho-CoA kinase
VEAFGPDILRGDGEIDRKALAGRVFSNAGERERLNAIVHPYVAKVMFDEAERALAERGDTIAVFDVPLLFEAG